ncbi:MAG TPA: SurA N-terminal domain-containing protein [Chthonomonadaceae bacterium]|nr:SurA N-terminal domain-containing protein [Chthonomonadaceae bacterium]
MPDPLSIETWRKMFIKHGQKFGWALAILFGLGLVGGFGWSQYGGRGQNAGVVPTNTVIATVNGDPITQGDFMSVMRSLSQQEPSEADYAQKAGRAMQQLIQITVLQQEAKKRGVRASDADVDRQIAQERAKVLDKNASDSDWDNYVEQAHHMSASEYRDAVAKQLVVPALIENLQSTKPVTEQEARNQNAQVRLSIVLIPTIGASPIKSPKALPDAQAKNKAEDLLKQAKAGADMAALAKANSGDFTASKGGDTNFLPEYQSSAAMSPFAALGHGKEFDQAVQNTPTGQFTPVVKVSGFMPGYAFAKVVARKVNTPKGFDVKLVMDQMKRQRAQKQLMDMVQADVKTAKVEFKDPDSKAYYDLAKLQQMQMEQSPMAQMQGFTGPAPTPAEIQQQQAMVDREFEDMLKRHSGDASIAKQVAEAVKRQMNAKDTTPAQRDALRDRLIDLYVTELNTTEDRPTRFELADLYRQKKDDADAIKQYDFIAKLLNADQPYDPNTMNQDAGAYRQLAAAYRSVNKPDEATKMEKAAADLSKQAVEEAKKEQAAQAATRPGTIPNQVFLPGGKKTTVNIPMPSGNGAQATTPGAKTPNAAQTPGKGNPSASKP